MTKTQRTSVLDRIARLYHDSMAGYCRAERHALRSKFHEEMARAFDSHMGEGQ
ncbi:MAG: hypothetical protein AABX11_04995 [Nanoarchaeota archaeon]